MLPISRGKEENKSDKIEAGLLAAGMLKKRVCGLLPLLQGSATADLCSCLPCVTWPLGTASLHCLGSLQTGTCVIGISLTDALYIDLNKNINILMCRSLCMPWFVALPLPMHTCLSHPIHPFLTGASWSKTVAAPLSQSLSVCSGFPPAWLTAGGFALAPCTNSPFPSALQ